MSSELGRQIEAFHRLRPKILEDRQDGWALIAHGQLVEIFDEYGQAACYADEHLPADQVLIKEISEEMSMVPFITSYNSP